MAQILRDRLETELLKSNPRLQPDEKSPDLVISWIVTSFEIPPEEKFSKNVMVMLKSPNAQGKQQTKAVEVPVEYKKIRGSLEASYKAQDRNHRTLDATNVKAKYSEDFEAATNQPASKSAMEKMEDPFKVIFGKKAKEPSGPPSPSELRDKLINDAIEQIVPRITTTNETVEVLLARGKLDEANKAAEGGLWTRYLEQLEQMTAFPKTKDDAYRLYNIGVAYEALAYQSENEDAAKKSLQEAAINYGKAVDEKPDEKNFLEPQKRIHMAMSYLQKLEAERKAFEAANEPAAKSESTASATPPNADPATRSSKTSSTEGAKPTDKSTNKAPPAAGGKSNNSEKTPNSGGKTPPAPTGKINHSEKTLPSGGNASKSPDEPTKAASKPAAPPLNNGQIIRLFKAGVSETSIAATIHDAPNVDFDLSVEGLIQLANGGVRSDKILDAMRARAKLPNRRTPNAGST